MKTTVANTQVNAAVGGSVRDRIYPTFVVGLMVGLIVVALSGLAHLTDPTPGTIYRQPDWYYDYSIQINGTGTYRLLQRRKIWLLNWWEPWGEFHSVTAAEEAMQRHERERQREKKERQWRPLRP